MADAATAHELTLTCKTEFGEYVFSEEGTCWALVTTQAPAYVEDSSSRAPLDLVAVVDKSGSMDGEKIRMVRDTLKFVVNQMSPIDRLGLVLYDSDVEMIGDGLVRMNATGKSKMLDEVERITTGSCTNLSGGLVCGMEMIERLYASSLKKNEVASVLLMTDGEANEGYTTTAEIIQCLTASGRASLGPPQRNFPGAPFPQQFLQLQTNVAPQQHTVQHIPQGQGIVVEEEKKPTASLAAPAAKGELAATVYTFGFGAQHNADLLQAISEAANGMYYFIDSAEKIPESFADCLGGLLSTVAQNISVELETRNGVNITSAFSGRDKKSSASGAMCSLPMGDIQSEERRDIVLKLSLPKLDCEQMEWPIVHAKLTYFNVITSTMETKETELSMSRPSTRRGDLESDGDVDAQKNRVLAAEAMQEALHLAEQGQMLQAQGLMQRTSDVIAASKSADSAVCMNLLGDLGDVQQQMSSTAAWGGGGKHALQNRMQQHMCQRSNVSSDNAYTTHARKSKKAALF